MTRNKELFKPLQPGKIGIYACGITVYDRCHLGNARSLLCFDVIVRFLRAQGFAVTYVRNITDIDDKIIKRANELGISTQQLTAQYIKIMHEDLAALYILPPDYEPKATENIEAIKELIMMLIAKGYAYVSNNGDICYQVALFKDYGKLAQQDLTGLQAGIRVEITKEKRSPLDFVLWKKAKPGEPSWPSTWGDGRPGWHIECSAMAGKQLGNHFDIHGGGIDLQFPHHENEIAQSEAAHGQQFANYWLHVGLLQFNNEKMAKSTGNFFTVADALRQYQPEVIRYFLLSSHYRSALNYSPQNLKVAHKALQRLYQTIKGLGNRTEELAKNWVNEFNQAMNDDFNTPLALAILFRLSHEAYKNNSTRLAFTLKYLAGILGLLQASPTAFLQAGLKPKEHSEINGLIAARAAARAVGDYAKADLIRADLLKRGIELEDQQTTTTWREKT